MDTRVSNHERVKIGSLSTILSPVSVDPSLVGIYHVAGEYIGTQATETIQFREKHATTGVAGRKRENEEKKGEKKQKENTHVPRVSWKTPPVAKLQAGN